MTGDRDVSRETSGPWQRYLEQEHAAREMYLLVVEHAHREYLAGPWPDRGAYELVERQAWNTYYAAGRGAWGRYQAALEAPPPPPARAVGYEPNFPPAYRQPRDVEPHATRPASHPYPVPARGGNDDALKHGQMTFTAYPGGFASSPVPSVVLPTPQFSPHPGSEPLDQFDERQETYLAADPETRDNQ